jgi:hypothetical protein
MFSVYVNQTPLRTHRAPLERARFTLHGAINMPLLRSEESVSHYARAINMLTSGAKKGSGAKTARNTGESSLASRDPGLKLSLRGPINKGHDKLKRIGHKTHLIIFNLDSFP